MTTTNMPTEPAPPPSGCVEFLRGEEVDGKVARLCVVLLQKHDGRKLVVFRAPLEFIKQWLFVSRSWNHVDLGLFATFEPTDLGWQSAMLCAKILADEVGNSIAGKPL